MRNQLYLNVTGAGYGLEIFEVGNLSERAIPKQNLPLKKGDEVA